jgi:pimeloyl-[acyl-carrier protein] methyl ester esterase
MTPHSSPLSSSHREGAPHRVFLHGWGLHGGIWSETLAALPGTAPDLPGYGGVPAPSIYSAGSLADVLADTFTGPVRLIGWSLGGMVALALAARHPDKVAKLVLVGASPAFVSRPDWSHGLASDVLAGFAEALGQDYRATLLRFLSLQARGGDAARQVIGRLRESVFRRGEPDAASLAAGLDLLRDADLRHLAPSVRCPTLVVHGGYDSLCPVAAGCWLAERIPGARLALHPRAAHAPFLSHPEWFVHEVGAFLDE